MEPDFKDYYSALGISSDADDATIKQTYRKLARQYHPDVNPGDKSAEERFKEVNEAYQVLSDPEKRRKYDAMRHQYEQWKQRGGSGGSFNWGAWQQGQGVPAGGSYYSTTVNPEDLRDLFNADTPFSDFFRSLFGGHGVGAGGMGAGYESQLRGRDSELGVDITLEEAFHGTTRTIQAHHRRLEARIPPGVRTGSKIRLAGQGISVGNSKPGDLYLVINVLPHPRFERENDDLLYTLPLDIYTAAVGGEVRIQTLDGSVLLKIPPRTQADRTFRLRGRGMPSLERPSERGDLYARVRLLLPDNMSDAELTALAQVRATHH